VGKLLPGLIGAVETTSRAARSSDKRAAHSLRSLAYHSVAMTLQRVGDADLAWTAADRSMSAAETAERPLLAAVSAYRLGYVLIRLKRPRQAEDLAIRAAEALASSPRRPSPPTVSVQGGLYLAAASASAARFDREDGSPVPDDPGMPPCGAPAKRRIPVLPDERRPITGGPGPTPRRHPTRHITRGWDRRRQSQQHDESSWRA
jgi:hypothetical protein